MTKLPILKKKISSFLSQEDGFVSKEKLLKGSVIIGSIAILASSIFAAQEPTHASHHSSVESNLGVNYDTVSNTLIGTHSHHANHASHSNNC